MPSIDGIAAEHVKRCCAAWDTISKLNTIDSWAQKAREVFNLMRTEGEEAADDVPSGWPRAACLPPVVRDLARSGQE